MIRSPRASHRLLVPEVETLGTDGGEPVVSIAGFEFSPSEEPAVSIDGFEFSSKGDPMVSIAGFESRATARTSPSWRRRIAVTRRKEM